MKFDEKGLAEGFTKPVIHSYIKERIGSQSSDIMGLIQVNGCAEGIGILHAYPQELNWP